MRCITIGAGAGACAGATVGAAEAVYVLLASLPAEYQAVGAAWTLYGLFGAGLGALIGVLLLPFRSAPAESLWCAAYLLVATPLAGFVGFEALEARLYDDAGVPVGVAAGLAAALCVGAAASWWMGRNVLTKTPLRILATTRGTGAAWGSGLVLAWIFALSPAPRLAQKPPPSAAPAASAPDLILVVVDSLRADAVGAYGAPPNATPHLDALAADSVVFEQAVAASTSGPSAVASLYTSLAVSSHGCERAGDFLAPELLTLAEGLADRGYRTLGFPNQAGVSGVRGFAQGFERYAFAPRYPFAARESTAELFGYRAVWELAGRYSPDIARASVSVPAAELVASGLATLAEEPIAPTFLMLQLMQSTPARNAGDEQYAADVVAVDAAVGQLVAGLRRAGRYDGSLIVVTADHGVPALPDAMGKGAMREAEVRIPLVVKLPGRERAGTRAPWQVRSIDIAPTLLDAGGGRPPPHWQGLELFTDTFEGDLALFRPPSLDEEGTVPPDWQPPYWGNHPASRDALVESTHAGVIHRALRRGGAKMVATLNSAGYGAETSANVEFYDLVADPMERSDQSAVQSSQQAGMRAAMESMVLDRRRTVPQRGPATGQGAGDRCSRCALGYLSPEECADCVATSAPP